MASKRSPHPAEPHAAQEGVLAEAEVSTTEISAAEVAALRAELAEALQHKAHLSAAMARLLALPWLREYWRAVSGYHTLPTDVLLPNAELRPGATPMSWESLGKNPQFVIPTASNHRHVRLEFEARFTGENPPERGKVTLFFDKGNGFEPIQSYTTYFSDHHISIDTVIATGGEALLFRLDPVDRPGSFVITKLRLRACNTLAAVLLKAGASLALLYRRRQLLSQFRHAVQAVVRGKFMHGLALVFDCVGDPGARYAQFIAERAVTEPVRSAFVAKAAQFRTRPVFSVILPTYNSPPQFLERALRSVMDQTYPHWEICIADDGSPQRESVKAVLDRLARDEPRIKVTYLAKNGGISHASNAALALASGDFIVLLDHDDEIQPHALHAFADAINRHPEADWLYSDEDKIDMDGNRFGPFFKPDWSPAFMLGCMYTCHLGVYRRSMVEQLGGFRPEFDLAQDYDLALRFASATRHIHHIPDILYSWRTLPASTASGSAAKPTAELKAREAVQAFLDRGPYKGRVEPGPHSGTHRVKFDLVGTPRVSIAIPSAGFAIERDARKTWHVLELVRSIREKTGYPNIEIVIADNGDFDPALTAALQVFDVKIVHFIAPEFNMSHKMNFVVEATEGEYVVILNDDMSVINGDWLEEMLMWAQQDDVCGVGAKLFFPDGRVQHAGILMLAQGPSHPYYLSPADEKGLACNAILPHEVSGVTGACMMMRREDYFAVGGFDPFFRINYNDVDFCLRLQKATGKRIIFTPYAQLHHYESVSREAAPAGELRAINKRWESVFGADPYYNRNLSQTSATYEPSLSIRTLEEDYAVSEA